MKATVEVGSNQNGDDGPRGRTDGMKGFFRGDREKERVTKKKRRKEKMYISWRGEKDGLVNSDRGDIPQGIHRAEKKMRVPELITKKKSY